MTNKCFAFDPPVAGMMQKGALLLVALSSICCSQCVRSAEDSAGAYPYNDFHYPLEEPAEMSSVVLPTACATDGGWHIVFPGPKVCVLERAFKQWGLMALLDTGRKQPNVRLLRKSVGQLAGIQQPRHNFSAAYFETMAASLSDLPSARALEARNAAGYADGELSFGALAQQLAPARDITEISLGSDVVKFIVSHSGRVKCSKTDITEVQNLSQPLPSEQVVVFDPPHFLQKTKWPDFDFDNMKSGLVGGYLRIANIGAYSADTGGFEMLALADASFHMPSRRTEEANETTVMVACKYSAAMTDTYIVGCPKQGCTAFASLIEAEIACNVAADCGGLTWYPNKPRLPGKPGYQLRGCGQTGRSNIGERSYVISNPQSCRKGHCDNTPPRLPNINYSPSVYIRLREQSPADTEFETATPAPESFRYWRASNSTPPVSVPAAEFYANLVGYLNFSDVTFGDVAATLRLPGAEGRRQRDQSLSGLLLASNNYVGNQANCE